jgi:hypothetical protein
VQFDVEEEKINGEDIAVKIRGKKRDDYLDPEFGSYEHISESKSVREVVEFYCPHCGVSLQHNMIFAPAVRRRPLLLNCPQDKYCCLRKGVRAHSENREFCGNAVANGRKIHSDDPVNPAALRSLFCLVKERLPI